LGEIIFRRMREEDLEDILAIERASFPSPWTRRAFIEILCSASTRNFVLERGGRCVGYLVAYVVSPEAHIANIAIDPRFRRRGLGAFLLSCSIEEMKKESVREFYLEVREGNLEARNLYSRLGFTVLGRRKRYYRDTGEDALVMGLLVDGGR